MIYERVGQLIKRQSELDLLEPFILVKCEKVDTRVDRIFVFYTFWYTPTLTGPLLASMAEGIDP